MMSAWRTERPVDGSRGLRLSYAKEEGGRRGTGTGTGRGRGIEG